MQLEYLYNMKLNKFNGEDFIHSQYVTSVILDNVYKNLNKYKEVKYECIM